ncbi:unnamed protein product [Ranitomeya imitator]|uniref:PXA domain-containing protein n=1 Tax=Ranitomeya imitator TaxID=111125 RepID=A0ABN9M184_9NEOB|nr:unnamed protein product [Ranitomeya imitator]
MSSQCSLTSSDRDNGNDGEIIFSVFSASVPPLSSAPVPPFVLCTCAAIVLCTCAAIVLRTCAVPPLSSAPVPPLSSAPVPPVVLRTCAAIVLRTCAAIVLRTCAAIVLRTCAAIVLRTCAAIVLRTCAAIVLRTCAAIVLRTCAAIVIRTLFDYSYRDYILSWYGDLSKDNGQLYHLLSEDFWELSRQLRCRLAHIDIVKVVCNDVVKNLLTHFCDLKAANTRQDEQPRPFALHPCLKTSEEELQFLQTCAQVLVLCLMPTRDAQSRSLRIVLSEILATKGAQIKDVSDGYQDSSVLQMTTNVY